VRKIVDGCLLSTAKFYYSHKVQIIWCADILDTERSEGAIDFTKIFHNTMRPPFPYNPLPVVFSRRNFANKFFYDEKTIWQIDNQLFLPLFGLFVAKTSFLGLFFRRIYIRDFYATIKESFFCSIKI